MTDQNKKQNFEPNNRIVLIGNTGAEAQEHTSNNTGENFVTTSLYTANSYQDDDGNRQDFASTLHNIIAYDPLVMKQLLSFKAGVRLRIEGKLTYRTFEVIIDGQPVNKKEAAIIAKKVEQAVLPSKKKAELVPQAADTAA